MQAALDSVNKRLEKMGGGKAMHTSKSVAEELSVEAKVVEEALPSIRSAPNVSVTECEICYVNSSKYKISPFFYLSSLVMLLM